MKSAGVCIFIWLSLVLWPASNIRAQSREGSSFDQAKFVPDIAFIMDVSAVARDMANEQYFSLETPGFRYPFSNAIGSYGSNARRGLNFNYGELSLFSVVDPYFDVFAVIDLSPDGAGLEEAYFTTRKLPYGFKVKAGKFLASFGRINEQHEHYWDFANRPLIAEALFGADGLNEIGAQVTWVPSTPFFLTLGAQVLDGANEQSFGATGFRDPGGSVSVEAIQGPNLYTGFVRTSFDVDEASFLLGISDALGASRTDQGFSSGTSGSAVKASTNIVGGDFTVKYLLDPIRYLSLQAEYMWRTMKGTEYDRTPLNVITSPALDKNNSGLYAQLAYRLDQRWRMGARCDLLTQNDVTLGGADQPLPSNLARYSLMVEYGPTEFSRLRLQLDRDLSRYDLAAGGWTRQPYTQIILQANLTIGAHGAHSF